MHLEKKIEKQKFFLWVYLMKIKILFSYNINMKKQKQRSDQCISLIVQLVNRDCSFTRGIQIQKHLWCCPSDSQVLIIFNDTAF